MKSSAVLAAFHGSPPSGFNGGRSQMQSLNPEVSGDFPYINLLRVSDTWQGSDTTNSNVPIDPSWLDSNGYPSASALSGSNGVFLPTTLPNVNSRPSNASHPMVVTWVGNSTIRVGNIPITAVSGSTSSVLNGYGYSDGLYHGRYVWYPQSSAYQADGSCAFQMNVVSVATGSSINNLQCYFLDDETSLLAGNIFGTQYKSILLAANPGVWRIMDNVLTNISNTTTWSTRKSVNYPIWSQNEYRAALYDETVSMTNSGNDYSLTTSKFTLADKLTMHVHFNATSTLNWNQQSGFGFSGPLSTLTVSLVPAIQFGWPSHPFVNNDRVGFLWSGNPPTGMQLGVSYYVKVIDANNFQISLTSGGAALAPASLNGGLSLCVQSPTLSLNGSAAYPIKTMSGNVLISAVTSLVNTTAKVFGTVVFDSTLQCWLLNGAQPYSAGLNNGAPPEISLRLCKEIGAHPYFSIPGLALDTMTDYVPSLAAEIKNNWPSWMIPRFEAGNELWNTQTPITQYGLNKAWNYWQSTDIGEWAGMVSSTAGQAVAAVYGLGNLGTTYEMLIGVQTAGGPPYPFSNPIAFDPRMTADQYVASGPAQAGYTQSAASGWASAIVVSNYVGPFSRGTAYEWQLAWDYAFNGNAADLDTYTAGMNPTGSAVFDGTTANVTWTGNPFTLNSNLQNVIFKDAGSGLPSNVTAGITYYVLSSTTNTFQFSATQGGTAIIPNAAKTVTAAYSTAYNLPYNSARWHGYKDWASRFGVNKMFAYEGGDGPDLLVSPNQEYNSFIASSIESDPFSGPAMPTNATQCVLDIRQAKFAENIVGGNQVGNPAAIGMLVYLESVSGMTQLNCQPGFPTFSSGVADVSWTGHNLNVNQVVQFGGNNLPSNVVAGQRYFVIATNLTTNTFQFSATRGGSAITPNASASSGVTVFSAFVVTNVSGTLTTIDVNTSSYPTATSLPFVNFPNSFTLINNFRVQALLHSTNMQAQVTAVYDEFVAQGGLFPSQYEVSGTGSIWPCIQPDIYGTQSGEYAAIVAFNH